MAIPVPPAYAQPALKMPAVTAAIDNNIGVVNDDTVLIETTDVDLPHGEVFPTDEN